MIETLQAHEIFVFGSNEGGHHRGGAARQAFNAFGARWGCAEGLSGQTYAIPTLSAEFEQISTRRINAAVKRFLQFAEVNQQLTFLVTPIGTGIAGYTVKQIAPMFKNAPSNVKLPPEFL